MLVVESMMRTPTVCVLAGTGNLDLGCDIVMGPVREDRRVMLIACRRVFPVRRFITKYIPSLIWCI